MDKKKRLLPFALIALTLALTAAAVVFGMRLHISGLALANVAAETKRIASENELLKTRRNILADDVGSKTDDTDRKNELNKEITKMSGDIKKMKTDSEIATKAAKELKQRAEKVRKTLTKLQNGMNPKKGRSISIEDGELQCPDSIKAGRYIATGDGIVTVIAETGSARASEDLLTIDTGSYTFDLAEGESVEADSGSVTLTELK